MSGQELNPLEYLKEVAREKIKRLRVDYQSYGIHSPTNDLREKERGLILDRMANLEAGLADVERMEILVATAPYIQTKKGARL